MPPDSSFWLNVGTTAGWGLFGLYTGLMLGRLEKRMTEAEADLARIELRQHEDYGELRSAVRAVYGEEWGDHDLN